MNDAAFFFRQFLKSPRQISSLMPTTKAVAEKIAAKIHRKGRLVVVEYGPGTGVLARAILQSGRLSAASKLILIETSKAFAERLKRRVRDKRVAIVHGSAENVAAILADAGETHADYIFSSIPLSVLPPKVAATIITATYDALSRDGVFIVFLLRRRVLKSLEKAFPTVVTSFEPINMPPLFIFEASKRRRAQKKPRHRVSAAKKSIGARRSM